MTLDEIKRQLNEEIKEGLIAPSKKWGDSPTIGLDRSKNSVMIYYTANGARRTMGFGMNKYSEDVVDIVRATLTKGFKCEHAVRLDDDGNSYFNIYSKGEINKVLISAKMADSLIKQRWSITMKGYCASSMGGKNTKMHRYIFSHLLGEEIGNKDVDHKNGNRLDNRIENLRLVSRKENSQNRLAGQKKQPDPHGFPAVSGVCLMDADKVYKAFARNREGRQASKNFPTSKLGAEMAFYAAVNQRLIYEEDFDIEILQERVNLNSLDAEKIKEAGIVAAFLEELGEIKRFKHLSNGKLDDNGFVKVRGVSWSKKGNRYQADWSKTINGLSYRRLECFPINGNVSPKTAYNAAVAKRKQYEREADEYILKIG